MNLRYMLPMNFTASAGSRGLPSWRECECMGSGGIFIEKIV